jgi:hypothetical protein
MPDVQSVFGKVNVFEDFTGYTASTAIADATAGTRFNDITLVAISGQTDIINTVDESGGVMSFTGAGGAADGIAILGSPAQPSRSGTIVMEARFKGASATDLRVFVGWQETIAWDETVNPFTLSSTTLTSNNGGNAVGFYTDTAATTDDFRVHASIDGEELTTAPITVEPALKHITGQATTTLGALGVRCGVTLTADSWYIARVEIDPSGSARGYFGHTSMGTTGPRLIATIKAGSLDQTALYVPHLHLAAASTGDPLLEVDYFGYTHNRDWAA